MLSMLENIFYKLMHRMQSKQREAIEKWTGHRICPKILKKLEKILNMQLTVMLLVLDRNCSRYSQRIPATMWTLPCSGVTVVDGSC